MWTRKLDDHDATMGRRRQRLCCCWCCWSCWCWLYWITGFRPDPGPGGCLSSFDMFRHFSNRIARKISGRHETEHAHFRPKSIHNKEIVDEFAKDYMYFACIRFINSVSPCFPPLSNVGFFKSSRIFSRLTTPGFRFLLPFFPMLFSSHRSSFVGQSFD